MKSFSPDYSNDSYLGEVLPAFLLLLLLIFNIIVEN